MSFGFYFLLSNQDSGDWFMGSKRDKKTVAETTVTGKPPHEDTEMDIKGTQWIVKVGPLLEMYQELGKVQDDSVRKSLKSKLGLWVASEWLDIPKIEPSQLAGHPSLIRKIEEARKEMRQIGVDPEVQEELARYFKTKRED